MAKKTWNIYHGEREYAKHVGDTILGTVEASTLEEAKKLAKEKGIKGEFGVGIHAAPAKRLEIERESIDTHSERLNKKYSGPEFGGDFGL